MKKGPPHEPRKPLLEKDQERQILERLRAVMSADDRRELRHLYDLALRDTALELRRDLLDCARLLVPRAKREARAGKTRLLRLLQRLYRSCRD